MGCSPSSAVWCAFLGLRDPRVRCDGVGVEVVGVVDEEELGAKIVAFPAVSTGVYGYPLDDAAQVAIEAVRSAGTTVDEVRFVLFDGASLTAFERALAGPAGSGPIPGGC